MELKQAIEGRRSIRKFQEKKIEHIVIEEIVAEAIYAPSWKNSQVVRYSVIENVDVLNHIATDCICNFTYNEKTIRQCKALVVVSVVKNRCGYERDGSFSTSKEDRWEMFDAGIAVQTFCLSAYEKGIGSVIMGIFDEEKVAEAIALPKEQKVAALIALGYPKENPEVPKRKSIEEILHII